MDWALREGSAHFDRKSAVFVTLRRIAAWLDELGIPYAVAGGLALFAHGYRRFTEDVDVVLEEAAISKLHEVLCGKGYLPVFEGSRNLRDTDTGVRIKFLATGEFPGDGKPKPVSFPNPADAAVTIDGIQYVGPESLIEMKLASGMSSSGRLRDLADVQETIKALGLEREFADRLDPSVREKFEELWDGASKG